MNPERQRIAIAKADGWEVLGLEVKPAITYLWGLRKGFIHEENKEIIHDYLNDLNAMHEAENILNADQMVSYDYHLDRVVGNGRQGLNIEYFLWSATAAQRAEAFLRTIGKWEESK